MKRLIILALIIAPIFGSAQVAKINWMSIEDAVAAQKKNPKKIMMDVYTQWCGPCKMMMQNTFTNNDVIAYVNEHYYAVKFDAESGEPVTFQGKTYENPDWVANPQRGRNSVHQFSRAMGVGAYPSLIFLDENQGLLHKAQGYKTPQDLEYFLKLFGEDDYKKLKNQEDVKTYQANFKNTFK